MRNLLSIFLIFILLFGATQGQSQTSPTSEQIKSALVFNFIKYTEWPQKLQLKKIDVRYLGDNADLFNAYKLLAEKRIHNLPITVNRFQNKDNRDMQVLILGKKASINLSSYLSKFRGKSTLIISDQAEDRQSAMINFILGENQNIEFEVNRYNFAVQRLKLSPEVLVLGGTELDIAQLLKELDQNLLKKQETLESQSASLAAMQKKINQREKIIKTQENKISLQTRKLKEQQENIEANTSKFESLLSEYNKLDTVLAKSREALEQNNNELSSKRKEIEIKEISISSLSKLIEDNKSLLAGQKETLSAQRKAIEKQESQLEDQLSTIRAQSVGIIVALAFIVTITSLVILTYRTSQAKAAAYLALSDKNKELGEANERLKQTQKQLVESEKMAALGNLVAGVAHEINTPLGVGVTAASHIEEQFLKVQERFNSGQLKRSELEKLISESKNTSELLLQNLNRASELIGNFKKVAVDQSSLEVRTFDLNIYLKEICQSLYPQFKSKNITLYIDCPSDITVHSYPGALAQIVTNLEMNSLVHGFENRTDGSINIVAKKRSESVTIIYSDNGNGISETVRDRIFEPFVTTKRGAGGSGLGMHICYNLATQKLKGEIQCIDSRNGACFALDIPLDIAQTPPKAEIINIEDARRKA